MSDNQTAEGHTGTKRDLIESKMRLDRAIEEFAESQRLGGDRQLIAGEQLHAAVIGLYWRMRPHIREGNAWDDIEDLEEIDGEIIWEGTHPQTGQSIELSGLKDIEDWIEKTAAIESESNHPNHASSSETVQVPVRLPAAAAIEAAKVLINRFDDLGWGVQPDRTPVDEPQPEHLDALLERRGQEEAREQLPARFRNGGDDDDE
jgi:hypothetical protein